MESNTSDSGRGSSESDVQTGCTLTIPKSKELGSVQLARKLENVHKSHHIHVGKKAKKKTTQKTNNKKTQHFTEREIVSWNSTKPDVIIGQ